jgi:hypothetical protein
VVQNLFQNRGLKQGRLLSLTDAQVNMLGNLTAWTVVNSEPLLTA